MAVFQGIKRDQRVDVRLAFHSRVQLRDGEGITLKLLAVLTRHHPVGKLLRLLDDHRTHLGFQTADLCLTGGTRGKEGEDLIPVVVRPQASDVRPGSPIQMIPLGLGQRLFEPLPHLGGELGTPPLTGLVHEGLGLRDHVEDWGILLRPANNLIHSRPQGRIDLRLVHERDAGPVQRLLAFGGELLGEHRQPRRNLLAGRVLDSSSPFLQFTCTLFNISLDNIIDFIQTTIEVLLDEGTLVPHILDQVLGQGVHRGQQGLVVPALTGNIGRQARSHALGHPVHQVISLHTLGHDTLGHLHATQDRPELLVHGSQSNEVRKLARPAQLVVLGRIDAGQGIVLL